MDSTAHPVTNDVVLLGAGHAHVVALRDFAMNPMPGVRITLVTRQVHTPYSGMLPGLIAGHYGFDQVHIDTGPLAQFAGARLYQSEVVGIDPDRRRVLCADRPPIAYDVLSIDIGSTPGGAKIAGVAAHAIPVKPIDQFLTRFEAARERVLASRGRARIGIVGGGAAGVELALALEARLRRDLQDAGYAATGLKVTLLTASDTILPTLAAGLRTRLERIVAERGIGVQTGARVAGIDGGRVRLEGGAAIELDEVFWTTQAAAAPWLASTGLALDPHGFVSIDDTLQSISHRHVFAAGDCASMIGRELPKSGVYAVRQGPHLAANIRRALNGGKLQFYRPQRDALYLVSTGERYAVGTRNGLSFEGAWAWRWKDRIDRAFMDRFNRLPEMAATDGDSADTAMRCGGCGAKVGAPVLRSALAGIEPASRPEVIVGLAEADDAAVVDVGGDKLAVQTVDYFRAMIDDPYLFGRIAANHALGDIYAMGAEPVTALAIATLPFGPEPKIAALLADLMTGANEVLVEAGCALAGGHTSEGVELALGFTINGRVARKDMLRKSGLVAGTALILTKPIGTGVLFAAHMRRKAKARWVMNALAHCTQSSRVAADILRMHGVLAQTDVTGFGLAGHLVGMLEASGVGVQLRLARIPLLDGAADCVAGGIVSSLQPQNVHARRLIGNDAEASKDPRYPLLFDAQTAGGLLAGVPADRAAACIDALEAAGYADAAVIGTVVAGTKGAALITIVA